MANSDQSSYTLRFNEKLAALEYSAGLNWITVPGLGGGGSPGGSNTQVQFNDSGDFGGSADLTWDGSALTTTSVSTPEISTATPLAIASTLQNVTVTTPKTLILNASWGVALPQLNAAEILDIDTATPGTLIWNTDLVFVQVWDGSDWRSLDYVPA